MQIRLQIRLHQRGAGAARAAGEWPVHFVACPSTTDPEMVTKWLSWASVGMEGVVYKRLDGASEPSAMAGTDESFAAQRRADAWSEGLVAVQGA
ncbi:hypothetical protein AB0D27_26235 [Streptomyces sp. NPDC048415]|uniref:hypothetical protein n=1 Tax=Streptomyces sp. NPDC048415 TaxID=3154822 RepID=UPI0034185E79